MAAIRPTRLRAQKDLLPREVHTILKHLKTHLKPLWRFLARPDVCVIGPGRAVPFWVVYCGGLVVVDGGPPFDPPFPRLLNLRLAGRYRW